MNPNFPDGLLGTEEMRDVTSSVGLRPMRLASSIAFSCVTTPPISALTVGSLRSSMISLRSAGFSTHVTAARRARDRIGIVAVAEGRPALLGARQARPE